MAKPPIQVHVQSSDFSKLLQLQAESVKELSTVRDILEKQSIGVDSPQRIQIDVLGELKQQTKQNREYYKSQAEFQKEWDEEAKNIAQMAMQMRTFTTLGERLTSSKQAFSDKYGISNGGLKKTVLSSLNIGGVFNKTLDRDAFIKKQMALGAAPMAGESQKDFRERLKSDYQGAHDAAKESKKTEAAIAAHKQAAGTDNEEHLKTVSPEFRALLEQRQKDADKFAKFDRSTDIHSPTPVTRLDSANRAEPIHADRLNATSTHPIPVELVGANITPTTAEQNKEDDHNEKQIEGDRREEKTTKILEQIAENTGGKPGQTNVAQKGAEPAGDGGLMGKIGKGLNSLGEGLKGLGSGMGEGIKAILTGIAEGVKAFGSMDVLKGALVMGVLGGAIWVMGKALQEFSDVDWETIGKGLVAVAGFGALAAVMGLAAPELLLGAVAIGAIGLALVPFGIAMKMAGEGVDKLADGLKKLDDVSGDNLIKLAEGLVAVGGAMTVFAAGQAAMGLSNLVTGFLGFVSGQKSPVDQMTQMAEAGEGLVKAGDGIKSIADGMAGFAKITPEQMKAVNEFPWLKATAFAAVGGAMRVSDGEQSVEVYNKSAQNQEGALEAQGGSGGNTHNVIAPTTNNNTNTTQNIQLPVRNQEQSMNRYMRNSFAF